MANPQFIIRNLARDDEGAILTLGAAASSEGFGFLERLLVRVRDAAAPLENPGEFFLCAESDGEIVGVGGVTPDPFLVDPAMGRVRHFYVHPKWRRRGVGKRLLLELETRAYVTYTSLRLWTNNPSGAAFYEDFGYTPVQGDKVTHVKARRA